MSVNPLGQYGLGADKLPQGPEYPGGGEMLAPGFCGGTMPAAALTCWATGRSKTAAARATQTAAVLTTDKVEPSSIVGNTAECSSCLVPEQPHNDRTRSERMRGTRRAPTQRYEELTR